jgi:hypothetical protein
MKESTYTALVLVLCLVLAQGGLVLLLHFLGVLKNAASKLPKGASPPMQLMVEAVPGQPPVDAGRWLTKLKAVFEEASAGGDAQRGAYIGAYMFNVPNFLRQMNAPELADAVQQRFFRSAGMPPPNGPPLQKPPAPPPAQVPPASS